MISSTPASAIDLYRSQTQVSAADNTEDTQRSKSNELPVAETTNKPSINTVSISDAAHIAATNPHNTSSTDYYRQFMSTYEGFSAANIAARVANPSLESFSAGKDFTQVAADARTSLDKNYEKLYALGKPFSLGNARAEDVNSLLGELDRRALYAVSSNKDDLFTADEQAIARSKMSQQQGLAMGLYSGPSGQQSKFVDPYFGDNVQKYKAGIQFLEGVSIEEKAGSIEFALQRAHLQDAYERGSLEQGAIAEDFTTDHPLVLLILAARDSVKDDFQRGYTEGLITTADDLKKQTWFEDYQDFLARALENTQFLYLPTSTTT
ncbi:MAG: hypothetical protein MJK13_01085 [Pseudomonadales bacterium]|nr:hypothetical protein [Pseudomonadales bacterium]